LTSAVPTATSLNLTSYYQDAKDTTTVDSLRTATGVYVTDAAIFYQPPRGNPYLDAIERQRGTSPYHDWNERIHHECWQMAFLPEY